MEKYVLYIGNLPLPNKGASAQRVISNAKTIKVLGYKPIIVGFEDYSNTERRHEFIFQDIDFISFKPPLTKREWFVNLISIKHIIKIVEEIRCNGDEVNSIIAYNYPSIALNRLMNYLRKNSINCFCDCTEWHDVGKLNNIRNIVRKVDVFFRMRYIHKRVDGLIVISSYLENYYKKEKKTILIPPLVDMEYLPKNVEQYKQFTIAYCGSPFRKDKLDLIVNLIVKNIISANLIIAGITKDQFISLYNYKKKIPNNIQFKGRVTHEESLLIMAKSHYTCFFRDNNKKNNAGFPTKFVESIAVKTPVITNNTSDLIYWIDKLDAGIILKSLDLLDIENYFLRFPISCNRLNINKSLQFSCYNDVYIKKMKELLES